VVLPDLDAQLGRLDEGLLTRREDAEGPIAVVTHGLPRVISAAHAELEAVRADVARRRALEELCVLYVAMTRAAHRLDLVVDAPRKGRSGYTFGAILRGALGVGWTSPESTDPWFPEALGRASEEAAPDVPRLPLRFAPSRRARSVATSSPSRAKDLGALQPDRLLAPIEAITARGRILHRLLEEVEWIELFRRSDDELLAIGRRIEVDEDAVRSAVAELRAILAHPEARRALAKPGEDARVWRERRFALVMPGAGGTETLWNGAFDRVVLRTGSAEIVDFKTDRVVDAEAYRPQMEAYRRALARITELDEASIATTLLFIGGDGVERVSLEPAAGSAGSGSGRS